MKDSKQSRWRRRNLAKVAAAARQWRKDHPGYSTPYVSRYRAQVAALRQPERAI